MVTLSGSFLIWITGFDAFIFVSLSTREEVEVKVALIILVTLFKMLLFTSSDSVFSSRGEEPRLERGRWLLSI